MDEKELKTSVGQRIGIIVIAVIMLGSILAGYVAIIAKGDGNGGSSSSDGGITEAKAAQYAEEYASKLKQFTALTSSDYDKFVQYKGEIKAYNETTANTSSVQTKDLLIGDGRELGEGDKDYLAYYVGWCADGSVFDSSFDDASNPTAFSKALDASAGLIEGWNVGVVGMKLGGIRRITVPGELAYGDSMEICGGTNKPLRFLIMAVANDGLLKTLSKEVDTAYMKVQYANYGIDYESLNKSSN